MMLRLRATRQLPRLFYAPAFRRHQSVPATEPEATMMTFFNQDRQNERENLLSLIKMLEVKLVDTTATNAERYEKLNFLHLTSLQKISDLEIKIQKVQKTLNLRSAMEVVGEVLRFNTKYLPAPILPPLRPGVQAVLDAVINGSFDFVGSTGPSIKYADAQAAVIAAVAAGGGIPGKTVVQSAKTLYHELSKHQHRGVSDQIAIQDGEQTMAEAIAAMSIVLFARRLWGCSLDVVYNDQKGGTVILSQL